MILRFKWDDGWWQGWGIVRRLGGHVIAMQKLKMYLKYTENADEDNKYQRSTAGIQQDRG